jgi:hypothetical protein
LDSKYRLRVASPGDSLIADFVEKETGFIIEFHGGNAEQYYNDAINYFASHHAGEAVDLLQHLRDDPKSHVYRDGHERGVARGHECGYRWASWGFASNQLGLQSRLDR